MSQETEVVLHKGGSLEHKKRITQIVVPDLWHIAQAEMDLDCRRKILECWHLCHDLKRHIEETEEVPVGG